MDKIVGIDEVKFLLNDINKRSKSNGIEYELDIREVDDEKLASLYYKSETNSVKLPVYTRGLSNVSLKEVYCILIGLDNAIQEN